MWTASITSIRASTRAYLYSAKELRCRVRHGLCCLYELLLGQGDGATRGRQLAGGAQHGTLSDDRGSYRLELHTRGRRERGTDKGEEEGRRREERWGVTKGKWQRESVYRERGKLKHPVYIKEK